MKSLILQSPAKLNLYLDVLSKRKDGYHNIQTIFERISLYDRIKLQPVKENQIKITSNHPKLPLGEENLAYQAAAMLKKDFSIAAGVHIHIDKRIPIGVGLGGGSSNAATVLLGLNKLWNLRLKPAQLLKFARRIGSDVPFFVSQASFALGQGRGEKITPLHQIKKHLWQVLVVPKLSLSTKEAYRDLDRIKKTNMLTRPKLDVKIVDYLLRNKQFDSSRNLVFNVFAPLVKRKYKVVQTIEAFLERLNLKAISLTGKGPAIFGLVSSRKEALRVYNRLRKESHWQVFVVKTF